MFENDNPKNDKDLQQAESIAYKPAYKQNQKPNENQPQNLSDDLAEIILVWPELPEHIKLAINALIQTTIQGNKK